MALMIWQIQTLMLVLMSILHLVNSQGTVSIPTSNLSPQLGDTGFILECNIVNFQLVENRALAWTKDGGLVSWNRDIHGGFNAKGLPREIQIGVTTYYYLDFAQVEATHGGTYKCLIANGQPTSYTEVASAEVLVQVPYFPPVSYPICSPNVPTIAVVGTDVTLSCTSLPGYPDEVTLILQRGGQALTSGGTVSGNVKELQTSYTITSDDSGMLFSCLMIGTGIYSTMSRTCNIGPLEVVEGLPRILPTMLTKSEGQDAIFTCELSSSGSIDWYTEPATQSSRSTSNGMTFTLLNVQLSDDGKIVVCMATIGGAVVESRAHLTIDSFVPPPTTKPPTTIKVTNPVVPVETNPPGSITSVSTIKQTTEKRPDPGNGQPTRDIVTNIVDSTGDSPITSLTTPLPDGVPDQIILIAIGAVGGLIFILIIVIVAACVCCYSRRPKPIIMTDGNQSDSGDSWDADGAMTRRSRIRVVDNPPPRLPASTNYGYEDAHTNANNLLKIPDDGLSTVRTSSTMSPSLAYAMDYLSQPEDPMRDDDMSSTAFTVDSRAYGGGMGQFDDHEMYSRGQTSFGDEYPKTPGTQGQSYEEDSGTFIRHPGPVYDSVAKDQDPDMPTYAVPHRDRSSKQLKNVDNNDERQISSYDNDQNAPDLTRHRTSSIPYVNTAFPRNSGGFVENSIYQSAEQNMQYF